MSHHMCVYFCSSNYHGVRSLFSFLRLLRQNVPSEDRTASKQLLRHLRQRKSQIFILLSLWMQRPLWGTEGVLPSGGLPTSFGGLCLWQWVEKQAAVVGCKAPAWQTPSLWMLFQRNSCQLGHVSPESFGTGCSFGEKATGILAIIVSKQPGNLEPNHYTSPKLPSWTGMVLNVSLIFLGWNFLLHWWIFFHLASDFSH